MAIGQADNEHVLLTRQLELRKIFQFSKNFSLLALIYSPLATIVVYQRFHPTSNLYAKLYLFFQKSKGFVKKNGKLFCRAVLSVLQMLL